jgi:ApaG protein
VKVLAGILARPVPVPDNRSMNSKTPYTIDVEVESRFVPDQSQPTDNRYVFAYTITLRNAGETGAQLMTRHWVIKDANGKVEEVRGDGVVGEQPWMRPGESFEYTSGAVLETAVGTMEGTYSMIADDGTQFDAPIPTFVLSIPRTLH